MNKKQREGLAMYLGLISILLVLVTYHDSSWKLLATGALVIVTTLFAYGLLTSEDDQ